MTEGGLTPELTTEQLLSHVPTISGICTVDCIQLLNLDSTNITPDHWRMMARCIRARYEEYDGFVITHGTDTMAYTAELPHSGQSQAGRSHWGTKAHRL